MSPTGLACRFVALARARARGAVSHKNTPPLSSVKLGGRGDRRAGGVGVLSKNLPADGAPASAGPPWRRVVGTANQEMTLEPAQGVWSRARTPDRHAVDAKNNLRFLVLHGVAQVRPVLPAPRTRRRRSLPQILVGKLQR